MVAVLPVLAPVLEGADGWSLEAMEHAMAKAIRFNGVGARGGERGAARSRGEAARRAAVQAVGARSGGVAADELHDRASRPTRRRCASASRDAAQYPVLKIKLGTNWDERIVRVVRELAPDKVLRVDANAAWTPKTRCA